MLVAIAIYTVLGIAFYRVTGALTGSEIVGRSVLLRVLDTVIGVALWPVIFLSRALV